jgi:hypothetical protein
MDRHSSSYASVAVRALPGGIVPGCTGKGLSYFREFPGIEEPVLFNSFQRGFKLLGALEGRRSC